MARKRYIGTLPPAFFPTSIFPGFIEHDWDGTGYAVTDESISIPADSPYVSELEFAPKADLEIRTEDQGGGDIYTIIEAGIPTTGQVLVNYANAYLAFASDEAGEIAYATYTGIGTVYSATKAGQRDAEIIALEQSNANPNSIGATTWAGPGTLEAFTLCRTTEGGLVKCDPSSGELSRPHVMVTAETVQGGTVSAPLAAGYVSGMAGLTAGARLFLGRDGHICIEGDSNFVYDGYYLIDVGFAITSTTMFLKIDTQRQVWSA